MMAYTYNVQSDEGVGMGTGSGLNKRLLKAIVDKACENQLDSIIPGLQAALRTPADVEVLERQFSDAAENLQKSLHKADFDEMRDIISDKSLQCTVFAQMLRELRSGNERYVKEALGI